jgi:lipopolysaccharide transport system ATP-binding protein
MSAIAIHAENLSKQYKVVAARQHDTLRDQLAQSFKSLFHRNGRRSSVPGRSTVHGPQSSVFGPPSSVTDPSTALGPPSSVGGPTDTFFALKDVSFEIREGEVVGIIGRNGAGKSTLLKILSRITEPTEGHAMICGRVGSLLEVGTGFHQELSGRENLYLNGAILGMKKADIDRKFDEIVAFAEIEKFIDTPVKHYSSGMYVRLAFAVAAHLEPDILIVDEVLAVGDASFQRKCLGKMGEVAGSGRTVLFVSHNMAAISRLCTRALWLDQGRLRAAGDVEEMIARYLASGADGRSERTFPEDLCRAPGSEYVRLRAVRIRNSEGQITNSLDVRLPFMIELEYRILRPVTNLRLGLRIVAHDGTVVFSTRDLDDGREEQVRNPGNYVSRCTIPGNFLDYGQYFVSFGADCPMTRSHFALDQALAFQIEPTGGVGGHVADGRSGLLRIQLPWAIEQLN